MAIQAGKLIRKVLVIDRKSRLGGVSVYTGTIPSKTLRETILNQTGWRDRTFYGCLCRVKYAIPAEDLKARLHKTLDYEVDAFNRILIPDEFRVSHPAKKDQNRHLFHVGVTSVRRVFCAERRFKHK